MSQNQSPDVLKLTKLRLGIMSGARDEFIQAIIDGVKKELSKVHGIEFDQADEEHVMFVVDLSAWRYSNEGYSYLPPYLRLRLNNLVIRHEKSKQDI